MPSSAIIGSPGAGAVIKRVMLVVSPSVDVNTSPIFPDGATGDLTTMFVVPSDYVAGDITVKYMIRGSGTSGNTAVFRRSVYRFRDAVAVAVIDSSVNMDQTGFTFDQDILRTFTIAAANFQSGDALRVDLSRLGLDAGDTYASSIHWDGGWYEYLGTVVGVSPVTLFDLVDAKGDLIVATANDTVARLAAGANDEVPIYDSAQSSGLKKAKIANAQVDAAAAIAVTKLGSVPSCKVKLTASHAVPTGVVHPIPFTVEEWDTDIIHDNVTNNTRLTCKTAGRYLFTGTGQYAAVAAGTYREIAFRLNGTDRFALMLNPPTSGGIANLTASDVVTLAVNDYVEFTADHDRGSDLDLVQATATMTYLGAT